MFKSNRKTRVLFVRSSKPARLGLYLIVLASIISALGLLVSSPAAHAATNPHLNFQARLQTAGGAIVPDGFYNVQFKLYSVDTAGTALWTESHIDTNGATAGSDFRLRVKNGYLTVSLGSQTSFPGTINWDQQLWITMNIGGSTQTATPTYDGEMNPRLKLTGVPYAFRAGQLATGNGTLQSTLSILQPTVGNQTFQIQDQGAGGTYNLCVQGSSSCGFAAGSGQAVLQGGNSFGVDAEIGTNDASTKLNFRTGGVTRLSINSAGQVQIGSISGAKLALVTGTTSEVGLLVQGMSGQTANILEIKANAVATPLFSVGSAGAAAFRNSTDSSTAFQVNSSSGSSLLNVDTTNGYLIANGAVAPNSLLQNPSFEAGGTASDASSGWVAGSGLTITTDAANANSGNKYLLNTSNSGAVLLSAASAITRPGEQFYAEAYIKKTAGADGTTFLGIIWYNKDGGTIFDSALACTPGTTYAVCAGRATAPATATRAVLGFSVAGKTMGSYYFDDAYMARANQQALLKLQSSVDSTTAFQVQDAAGTSNILVVDTVNNRVGIGNAAPANKLDVTGTINASTGYRAGGVAGITGTCSGGQFLQNAVVAGGIVTGGSCAAGGDGGVTTVGTIDSQTKSLNGAVISGTNIYMQTADATNPGLVSTGTQTFAGAKTFSKLTANTNIAGDFSLLALNNNATGLGIYGYLNNNNNTNDLVRLDNSVGTAVSIKSNGNITSTGSLTAVGVNAGAGLLQGSAGLALASGNFSQTGAGTFGTGTGAVSLNGVSTVGVNDANAFRVQTTGGTDALRVDTSNNTVYATNIDALSTTGGSPGAISRVNRTAATSTAHPHGTGSYTPAGTFTPTSNTVLVAHIIALKDTSGTPLATNGSDFTISGGSLTWVPIIGRGADIGNTYDMGFRSFYAIVASSPGSMQVTVDTGTFPILTYHVLVDEYTNVDTTTPVAGAIAANRMSANNNTFSLTLGATPTTGDVKIGVSGVDEDFAPGGYDTPAGWTQLHRQPLTGNGGPDNQVLSRTGVTTTSLDWDMSGSLDYSPNSTTVYGGFILKQDTNTSATNLNIGTAAESTVIGNTAGASSLLLQAGAGGVVVKPADAGSAFQVQNSAGTSIFSVNTSSGSVTINASATNYTQRLCHNQANGATAGLTLGDCASSGQADLAEFYDTVGPIEPGDIVATNSQGGYKVEASSRAYQSNAIGIISTNPIADGIIGHNLKSASRQPVALAGRVPVKVSLENGSIAIGDPLTTASTPGTAMKATGSGQIIGYALEAYGPGSARVSSLVQAEEDDRQTTHASELAAYRSDPAKWAAGTGKIMVFVQTGYNQSAIILQGQTTAPPVQGAEAANINTGKLNAAELVVAGDVSVGGNLTVARTATVASLRLTGHFITAGAAPEVTSEAAAGSTGELAAHKAKAEVTGNDTSGTITVTAGDGATTGRLARLTFHKPFGAMPRILITALGKDSAGLAIYVDEAQQEFFIISGSQPPVPGQTYTYTYYVVQ